MQHMTPVDLLIIEGWKAEGHDKIEVHRPAHGKPLIQPEDSKVVAVASDAELPGLPVPRLDLNDVEAISGFIVAPCRLAAQQPPGVAGSAMAPLSDDCFAPGGHHLPVDEGGPLLAEAHAPLPPRH